MSASARTARLRDKAISRGFKVQNTNSIAATSLLRGVVPCLTNYDQLLYTSPICGINSNCSKSTHPPRVNSVKLEVQAKPKTTPIPPKPKIIEIPVPYIPSYMIDGGAHDTRNSSRLDGSSPFASYHLYYDGGRP